MCNRLIHRTRADLIIRHVLPVIALKLIVFPLVTLAILSLLPLERNYIRGVYVMSCVPVGNLVLSFSEMLGEGQDVAANVVLLSTILSMLTIPVMLMLI